MTTTIKISTDGGVPVKVTETFIRKGGNEKVTVVPAHQEATFYVHSGVTVQVHEMEPYETETYTPNKIKSWRCG